MQAPSQKKILITGGCGFLGSHLCEKLISKNNYIYCLDNLFTGKVENISDMKINYLMNEIKKVSKELKFISMSRTNESTNINLDVKPKKFEDLSFLTGKIKKRFPNSKVILAYNDDLSL